MNLFMGSFSYRIMRLETAPELQFCSEAEAREEVSRLVEENGEECLSALGVRIIDDDYSKGFYGDALVEWLQEVPVALCTDKISKPNSCPTEGTASRPILFSFGLEP